MYLFHNRRNNCSANSSLKVYIMSASTDFEIFWNIQMLTTILWTLSHPAQAHQGRVICYLLRKLGCVEGLLLDVAHVSLCLARWGRSTVAHDVFLWGTDCNWATYLAMCHGGHQCVCLDQMAHTNDVQVIKGQYALRCHPCDTNCQ